MYPAWFPVNGLYAKSGANSLLAPTSPKSNFAAIMVGLQWATLCLNVSKSGSPLKVQPYGGLPWQLSRFWKTKKVRILNCQAFFEVASVRWERFDYAMRCVITEHSPYGVKSPLQLRRYHLTSDFGPQSESLLQRSVNTTHTQDELNYAFSTDSNSRISLKSSALSRALCDRVVIWRFQ